MLAADAGRLPYTTESNGHPVGALWSRIRRDAAAAAAWLRRARCGVGGHMMVKHFEPERLSLECVGCGKRTTGWSLR